MSLAARLPTDMASPVVLLVPLAMLLALVVGGIVLVLLLVRSVRRNRKRP